MTSILAKKRVRPEVGWDVEERSDEELLDRYLAAREPDSQEAFRELVVRHGPMVLGVCRHVLNQDQDAEDAFQATFLVLARQGATIRDRRVLSGWLHEVAFRVANRLRTRTVRRRAVERQGMAMLPADTQADDQGELAAWNELRPVLHEELDRLPAKYRVPVILSYLEGKTNEEVAALLQWPVGTVKGRLSRAREMLRSRLTRRGLALSAAFLMTALSRGRVFAEAVPSDLVQRTVVRAFPAGGVAIVPDSTWSDAPADADLMAGVGGKAGAVRGWLRISRIGLIVGLLLIISASVLSVAIGGSMAALAGGWRRTDRVNGYFVGPRVPGDGADARSQDSAAGGAAHCQ